MSTLPAFISPADLLKHWQELRRLTRRVIEAFPEDQLFTFSIGGMRPFSKLAGEMVAIAAPMVKGIVTEEWGEYADAEFGSKEELLKKWDADTEEIGKWFGQIPVGRFPDTITSFGQFTGPVWSQILYAIDNENHHRGQGYAYLRALGVEPPAFWQRD